MSILDILGKNYWPGDCYYPPAMPDTWLSLHEAVSAFKRTFILDVLSHFGGNRSRTAAALGIERTSLLRLIRDLSIAPVPRPPRPQEDRPAASTDDDEVMKVCPRCRVDLRSGDNRRAS